MKRTFLKILTRIGLIFILISVIIGLFLFNNYLKSENLLFYQTGIEKRAILNATWNMSYKEVERANNQKLKDGIAFTFVEKGLNRLLDLDRVTAKKVELINLWTFDSELIYYFFDNRLFRYRLCRKIYNAEKFDSIAVRNLELSYGEITRYTSQSDDSILFDGRFFKNSVLVELEQFAIETEHTDQGYRFLIEVTYQPTFKEIIKTADKQQQSIFQ